MIFDSLQKKAFAGQYKLRADDQKYPDRIRVLSVIIGSGKDATFVAILDKNGVCEEFRKLNYFRNRSRGESSQYAKDVESLTQFIATSKPDVVVVGAESMDCRRSFQDLEGILKGDHLRADR